LTILVGQVANLGCQPAGRLSIGLSLETQPTSGKLGAAVKILGSNLTGATSVSFNGTAATFTVVSRYLLIITTTVPAGATTGTVEVATPGGTLSSNVPLGSATWPCWPPKVNEDARSSGAGALARGPAPSPVHRPQAGTGPRLQRCRKGVRAISLGTTAAGFAAP
jgi:hypothetical protein